MPEQRRGRGGDEYQRHDGTWVASKNEGLYQRADGLWIATFSYDDPATGKTARKTFSSKIRSEARQKRDAFKARLNQGLVVDGGTTIATYLDGWLPGIKRRRRWKTYRSYEQNVRLYITPQLGHIRLTALTRRQVQTMLDALRARGLAPNTAGRVRDVLRKALNDAIADRLIDDNPATRVEITPPPQTEIGEEESGGKVEALTIEEARRFAEAADSHRLGALYLVALTVGARQGEMLGLLWKDVDLEHRTIRFVAQLQRVEGKFQRVVIKSKAGRRTVAIPTVVVPVLEAHRVRQLLEREANRDTWHDSEHVFCTSTGNPLDGSNVTKYLHQLLEKAALSDVDFHGLRHSCASVLAALRVPLVETSKLLGHSDPRLTLRIYSHASDQTRRGPADAMDTIFGP